MLSRAARSNAPSSKQDFLGALPRTPRFELHRMRNIRGRDTAGIALPTTRTANRVIDSSTKFFFRLEGLSGIAGECFVSSAIDTAKRQDVPVGLSGEHRKTSLQSYSPGTTYLSGTIRQRGNYTSKVQVKTVKIC